MPRYIDAEKLPNAIGKALNKLDEEISPLVLTEVCISIGRAIKEAPTADVEEVVRCCDCTYAHFNPDANAFKCQRRGYYSEEVKPDDFCNHGVRIVLEGDE